MSNFKLTSDNKQSGKTIYNAGIVHNIVALAVAEVEGTVPHPDNKNGISLFIEKDGVYADVSVIVKYGYNIPELAYRIQQSVKQSVENMTRFKVAEVDVHIQDVVFCETVSEAKENETTEAETREDSSNEKNED
jgi:uncharacterized alkaline shock family protein YloU